jgi:hypothetical protein
MSIQRINRGSNHWYKIDGKKADGVTTLLSQGLAKPWLGNWAAKTVAEHVADNLPDEIAGYVESCVRFLDEWKIEPIVTEATVASRKWNYCGTLDLVGKLPDGRVLLADYKTSKSGIFAETVLQQAAYRYAEVYLDGDVEKPVADLGITDCAGVWITPNGYEVFPLPSDERAFKDFLHVAWVARWAQQSKELIGPSVTAPEWFEVAS